jgi:hypothetical protein
VVIDFLFWTSSHWRSSEVAVKSCCVLLKNHKAAGLLLVRLTRDSCFWIVAVYFWVIILLLNYPVTVQLRPKRKNTVSYGNWKVNIVKIWRETGSLSVLATFFHRINYHSLQPKICEQFRQLFPVDKEKTRHFKNNSKGHLYCLVTPLKRQKFSTPDFLVCIQ